MKQAFLFVPLLFAFSVLSLAQDIPQTNVYAFKMQQLSDTVYNFSQPRFLTAFNPNGYNNQPNFIDSNTLYLTVQFPNEPNTNIYALDLAKRQKTQITATVESEYSPTRLPNSIYFSTVRVEADGQQTQRLWKFPLDRSNMGEPLFSDIRGVGYHYWVNDYKVALFIVGQPSQLILANTLTGSRVQLINNIGRGFQRLPGDNLAFIHKISDQNWQLKEMDTYTYRSRGIIATLPNSEDFLYTQDGTFLMGSGSKLFKFNKYSDREWIEIADFKYYGIKNITRLALSSNGTFVLVDRVK